MPHSTKLPPISTGHQAAAIPNAAFCNWLTQYQTPAIPAAYITPMCSEPAVVAADRRSILLAKFALPFGHHEKTSLPPEF